MMEKDLNLVAISLLLEHIGTLQGSIKTVRIDFNIQFDAVQRL